MPSSCPTMSTTVARDSSSSMRPVTKEILAAPWSTWKVKSSGSSRLSSKANKISVIVDETGIPWGITFHKGNKHDAKAFAHTTHEISKLCKFQKTYDTHPKIFLGDRAYDSKQCDALVQFMGWTNKVARKRCPHYSFSSIRVRVEHVFSWLDKYRRIIVRYERSIIQYKSFTYLAMCHLLSRRLRTEFLMC